MERRFSLRALLRAHPEYCYALFVPAFLICFFLVERLVPPEGGYWVSHCALDDRIPFAEVFVIPYCLWYPLLLFTGLGLMLRDTAEFRRYMWFLMLGFGFSLLFCLAFPNGQDLRPSEFPRSNVFTWLLGRIYAADTNTNVLPSMHVIGACAAALSACRSRALGRWAPVTVVIVAVLICLSTVFVKQHSVLDVLAGFAVSLPLALLLHCPRKRAKSAFRK